MGYAYQAVVTIPAAPGSTQTDVTVAIRGTATAMKTVANGGQVQNTVTRVTQTVPADLILSSDAGGTALYNWGWDLYDPATGEVVIWVKIPSLTSGAPVSIYISVGNAAVNTYQGGAVGAEFDAATTSAYHLPNGSTLNILDFSASAFTSTNHGAVAGAGQIDGAGSFDPLIPAWIDLDTPMSSFVTLTDGTLEAWAFLSGTPGGNPGINEGSSIIQDANEGDGADGYIGIGASGQGGENWYSCINSDFLVSPVTLNAWTHVAMTFSAGTARLYVNGVQVATGSCSPVTTLEGKAALGINWDNNSQPFPGLMDEVRTSNIARSADWIATEFANQFSPPVIGSFSPITPPVTGKPTRMGFSYNGPDGSGYGYGYGYSPA